MCKLIIGKKERYEGVLELSALYILFEFRGNVGIKIALFLCIIESFTGGM